MRRGVEYIFVDTSAWWAYCDVSDQYHQEAIERMSKMAGNVRLVTTDYVFDETITGLRFHAGHKKAVEVGTLLLSSKTVWLVDITPDVRSDAWKMFCKYSDKGFSFTDCTSFPLMKSLKIKKAFTFDEHFRIMGFEITP